MRILVTADLHYGHARSRPLVVDLARKACRAGGDAIVLAGDTAGPNLAELHEALELFSGFPGRKFLVPGNHCLWCRPIERGASLRKYEQDLPAVAAGADFALLDHQPTVMGRVGLVGSIGWYDYGFRDESLGIPLAFYQAKMAPGAAAMLGREDLLNAHAGEISAEAMNCRVRWMDGWMVDLGMDDEAFLARIVTRLEAQLADMAGKVDRIVAVLHHLPFSQLVPRNRPMAFAFAAAYLGSDRLGEVLLACGKVRDVFCGHSHWPARETVGHVRAVNVGSTYKNKHLEVLTIED